MKPLQYFFCLTVFLGGMFHSKAQNHFPFLKQGNEWIYEGDAGNGKFNLSYKILLSPKNGYYQIQTRFIDNDIVSNEMYWHSDGKSFSFFTAWPLSPLKLTLLTTNSKPGDSWEVFIPESLDPEDEGLSGFRRATIISINEIIKVPAGTFDDCIKVKETFSSEPNFYMNYFINKYGGIIKMEGSGYMKIDGGKRKFFQVKYELKSTNY